MNGSLCLVDIDTWMSYAEPGKDGIDYLQAETSVDGK